jgi:hypothetical protein
MKLMLKRCYQWLNRRLITPFYSVILSLSPKMAMLGGSRVLLPEPRELLAALNSDQSLEGEFAFYNVSLLRLDSETFLATAKISSARFPYGATLRQPRSFVAAAVLKQPPGARTFSISRSWELLSYADPRLDPGTEDHRLICWNGGIYTLAAACVDLCRWNERRNVIISKFAPIDSNQPLRFRLIREFQNEVLGDSLNPTEKNWSHLVDPETGSAFLMRSFEPRVLYRLSNDQFEPDAVLRGAEQDDHLSFKLRSPSPPISIEIAGRKLLLGMLHSRKNAPFNLEYARTYSMYFYLAETAAPFRTLSISREFRIRLHPRGFIYPFQAIDLDPANTSSNKRIGLSMTIHDESAFLYETTLGKILDCFDADVPQQGA